MSAFPACVLDQERNTLWEVCETPGLLELLPDLLKRKANQQQLEQLIQEFRSAADAAAAAAKTAAAEAGASGVTTDTDSAWKASTCSNDGVQAAAAAAGTEQQGGDGGIEEAASGDDDNLEKAQAHIAWLLAALASDPRTRCVNSMVLSGTWHCPAC